MSANIPNFDFCPNMHFKGYLEIHMKRGFNLNVMNIKDDILL